MKDFSRVQLATLDEFSLAIIRVDQAGALTYLNDAARDLIDCPSDRRLDLRMLFPEPEDYRVAVDNLQSLTERSISYRATLLRPCTIPAACPIPVEIHAFPHADADGNPNGAIAIIVDLREAQVREAINVALGATVGSAALLDAVAGQLRTLVPFDELHVTIIDRNRKRMRELYAKDERRNFWDLVRWWNMPGFIRAMLPFRVPELCHVDMMLANPRYAKLARTDPDTKAFFELGVREFLSLPIRHENRVVAFLALYSYRDGTYTEDHLEQLSRLPLAEAVLTARHRDRDQQHNVILDLLQRLGQRAVDMRKVAQEMVNELLSKFELEEWEHVSLFRHDADAQRICLLCQANRTGPSLPDHFDMPVVAGTTYDGRELPNGPIGQAILTGNPVNRANGRESSPWATLPGFDANGSQLALPIVGAGSRWVLYVESRVHNAFAEEEIELLTTLTERVGAILAHSELFEVQSVVLDSIEDMVIATNADGRVRWSNQAAQRKLGVAPGPGSTTRLDELAMSEAAAELLREPQDFYHREAALRQVDDRRPLTVLLSASTPKHTGGRVYVASDFTYQKAVQRLDEFGEVFAQAALESRVPLALVDAWLNEHASGQPFHADEIDKIQRQLGRADLPLERLMRLSFQPTPAAAPVPTDLGEALAATLAGLPASLREGIDARPVPTSLLINGDFNDIQFCIESMISFGVRTRPESKRLRVRAVLAPPRAALRVEGDWIPNSRADVALAKVDRWRRKTVYDLMLGDSVIRHIVVRTGGDYTCRLDDVLLLEISLPLYAGPVAAP
jgi:PAS domain-containing protein